MKGWELDLQLKSYKILLIRAPNGKDTVFVEEQLLPGELGDQVR